MSKLWRRCLERLEGELSVEDLHTYLMPLQASEDGDGLRLLAPNAYTLDFVRSKFQGLIERVLAHVHGAPVALRLEVGTLASRRPEKSGTRPLSVDSGISSTTSIRTTPSTPSSRASPTSSARRRRCRWQ
jgi:chromosomal replication initiator protein